MCIYYHLRNYRNVARRQSGGIAFQLGEMTLSQVKEELSGMSRDTENNTTPNNEPISECVNELSHSSSFPMMSMGKAEFTNELASLSLEETHV